jgi:hypothetical protein
LPLIATVVNRKLNNFLQFSIFRQKPLIKTHDFEANQPFKGFHSLKHGSRRPAVRSPGVGAWGEQSLHGSAVALHDKWRLKLSKKLLALSRHTGYESRHGQKTMDCDESECGGASGFLPLHLAGGGPQVGVWAG